MNKKDHRFHSRRILASSTPASGKFISLEFVGGEWPSDKFHVNVDDKFILRNRDYFHFFLCPTPDCGYNTNRQDVMKIHEKTCNNDIEITYKQQNMTEPSIRKWCIDNKYLDENYHQTNFVTFDIETLGDVRSEQVTESTFLHNIQRLVTISVTKSFGPSDSRTIVFRRKGFTKADYESLISQFMSHLEQAQSEMVETIPERVLASIQELQNHISQFRKGESQFSPGQFTKICRAKRYLNLMTTLKVYGYNSSGFDLPVLFQGKFV